MSWPEDIPRLFPPEVDVHAPLFSNDELDRLGGLTLVQIAAHVPEQGDHVEHLGMSWSLSWALIRNAQLHRGVSVRGGEDGPDLLDGEDIERLLGDGLRKTLGADALLTSELILAPGAAIRLRLHGPGKAYAEKQVVQGSDELPAWLVRVSETVAQLLRAEVSDELRARWSHGMPERWPTIQAHGELLLAQDRGEPVTTEALRALWSREKQMGIILWTPLDDQGRIPPDLTIEGFAADPYNAQLAWTTALALLSPDEDSQPWVTHYQRRALELAPAHGKAHMTFAFHLKDKAVRLRHSELGYLLLPTNAYAISNYLRVLRVEEDIPLERFLDLSDEAIALDPLNYSPYFELIGPLSDAGRYTLAIAYTERLLHLVDEMAPRTRASVREYPLFRAELGAGRDPLTPGLEKDLETLRDRRKGEGRIYNVFLGVSAVTGLALWGGLGYGLWAGDWTYAIGIGVAWLVAKAGMQAALRGARERVRPGDARRLERLRNAWSMPSAGA